MLSDKCYQLSRKLELIILNGIAITLDIPKDRIK